MQPTLLELFRCASGWPMLDPSSKSLLSWMSKSSPSSEIFPNSPETNLQCLCQQISKSTTAAVGKFYEQIFLEIFPRRFIWTKVSRFAYLWLCVFLIRLLELPILVLWKNLPIISVQNPSWKAEHIVMRHFQTFINLNVMDNYLA